MWTEGKEYERVFAIYGAMTIATSLYPIILVINNSTKPCLTKVYIQAYPKNTRTKIRLYFSCIIVLIMPIITASSNSQCSRSCIFPSKDSFRWMGDRRPNLKFTVLNSCFWWPTLHSHALTGSKVVILERHTLSLIIVFACFYSFYCAFTISNVVVFNRGCLLESLGAFGKKQTPRLWPQSSDSSCLEWGPGTGIRAPQMISGAPALRTPALAASQDEQDKTQCPMAHKALHGQSEPPLPLPLLTTLQTQGFFAVLKHTPYSYLRTCALVRTLSGMFFP